MIPPHESDTPTVVLPMTARDAFLTALVEAHPPAYLSLRDPALNGWHERRGTIADLGTDLRRGMTNVVCIEPWPVVGDRPSLLGQGCTVEVEFWERSVQGDLVAPRRNPYADRMPAQPDTIEVEVEGVKVPTLPLMAAPTVAEVRFPVDVVYTWVDGSDPVWNAAREERLAGVTGTAQSRESSGRARFIAHDELRYSFRSIHLFAPWVRRIHLVTAGQVPDWLDPDHPMVNLVDHAQILPADGAADVQLPRDRDRPCTGSTGWPSTSSTSTTTSCSAGRCGPETLFTASGLAATYFSRMTIGLTDTPDAAPFLKAAWNNRALLQDAFGAVTTRNLAHAPYAHRVSVLQELPSASPSRWPRPRGRRSAATPTSRR